MYIEQIMLWEGTSDQRAFPRALGELLVCAYGASSWSQRSCSLVFVKSFSRLLAKLFLSYQFIQGWAGLKQGVLWVHFMPTYWEKEKELRMKCWVYFTFQHSQGESVGPSGISEARRPLPHQSRNPSPHALPPDWQRQREGWTWASKQGSSLGCVSLEAQLSHSPSVHPTPSWK